MPPDLGLSPTDPVPSATMAGGLFAMHRQFWLDIGRYDLDMGGWGGEVGKSHNLGILL